MRSCVSVVMQSICMTTLLLWVSPDSTNSEGAGVPHDTVSVALGESFTLRCEYNCSKGFVRGCWSPEQDSGNAGCMGTISQDGVCAVSLHFPRVSPAHGGCVYVCYSEDTAHPELKRRTERRVTLRVGDPAATPTWTAGSDTASHESTQTEEITASSSAPPTASGEEAVTNVLLRVFAVSAVVIMGLSACLAVKCRRKDGPVDSKTDRPSTGSHADHSPARDDHSDSEVAYADIVITIRGASSPELSQICSGSHEGQRERWRDETYLTPFLSHLPHVSRSADRLNGIPREISRKLSTNSEYAIITYS